jgi:enamine deaminase RidA (YjgF/YER057c/UK114 family)
MLRAIAIGSLAVSVAMLALVAHTVFGGSAPVQTQTMQQSNTLAEASSSDLQMWDLDSVIVPYGFKGCDSSAMPPQIAPIRKNGDFVFLSGILGYDKPCASAVKNVTEQIVAAFKWANQTLAKAGVTWKQVLTVTSYHVDLVKHQNIFAKMRTEVLPKPPYPAWTAVGVDSLYFDGEVFEMTIVARKTKCVGLECDR